MREAEVLGIQCYLTEVTRVMGTICSLYPAVLEVFSYVPIALLSGSLSLYSVD